MSFLSRSRGGSQLIRGLDAARGNGTSMISLILPPKSQISQASKMLQDEMGTATNIKSRVNRQSVLGAITSALQRLKLYNKVPANGLVLFTGTVLTDEGKEKKVNFDFEPFKPINTSLYLCDNKFHTEALGSLLQSDNKYGFIVMDGNGSLFGTLSGNHQEVLHRFTVDLPKKHGRGGQSALRFARLRLEKRHNYIRKVAETATQLFITDGQRPNVAGLVMAGSSEFKYDIQRSDLFDPRLLNIVLATVDVSYGGENGFNQAIALAGETLANVKFVQEKKLISQFFSEIEQDSNKYVFGVKDTLMCLEMGAVETLIVYEDLDVQHITMVNASSGSTEVKDLTPKEMENQKHYRDEDGNELEVTEKEPMVEWLAETYKKFGCTLQFVSDKSQEGSQFVKGFGKLRRQMRQKHAKPLFADLRERGINEGCAQLLFGLPAGAVDIE